MSGFKNTSLNIEIASRILDHIIIKMQDCFNLMIQDCSRSCIKIANNENKIRDYFFCNYLNNDKIMRKINFDNVRFFAEVPVNYLENTPLGRTDLQVVSINEFNHRNRYFIIECKRIDGQLTLNREYINEGIRRFVGGTPKYISDYKVHCMLGFVVKQIDVNKNVDEINSLLRTDYSDIVTTNYLYSGVVSGTYVSTHVFKENDLLELKHIFLNCDSVII